MKRFSLLISLVLFSSFASAQNITGTVTNGTTAKPAAGEDVSLLSLAQGMQEVGSAKTDAQGKFSIPAPPNQQTPMMVRVTHDGVGYFPQGGPLMPGTTTAQLTIYDSAKKVDGLSQTVEVDRYQSDGSQLQVIALYAVRNESKPPTTLSSDNTFEFALPVGAQIDQAYARAPGGQPVSSPAAETAQKNRYAFSYPLRPGETQFQVAYHLPYKGAATLSPKPLMPTQHFVVMTPTSMKFEPKDASQFKGMPDQPGVMVVTDVKPGQDLSFRISGTGSFQEEQSQGGGSGASSQAPANDNRPGGGLGAPIDAPDPLHDYRAFILGGFALVLVMGGFYVVSKSNQQKLVPANDSASKLPAGAAIADSSPPDRQSVLLDALKDELFHLEVDRAKGSISQQEYEKAKAALDATIRRALARSSN